MTAQIVPDTEHKGLIAALPPTLRDYAQLARFDRPIGWWLLFWPCAWGVLLAGGQGEWALIGSSNWDARSFRLNFEFDLEIIDRDLTARIDALIDERISRGTALTPDMLAAEPVWKRLRNAAARLAMPYL